MTRSERDALAEVASVVRGRVVRDTRELDVYARDASGMIVRRPLAVVEAATAEDVIATLRIARSHALPVTMRGAGWSCHGQSVGEGIVLRAPAPQPVRFGDRGVATVSASMRWRDVVAQLRQVRRSQPVLTAWLETTVGGTLSTGGYGIRSIARGNQLDHVRRVRLILPGGDVCWCDRDDPLFRFAIGSLGQLGCIDLVELQTLPLDRAPRIEFRVHSSLGAVVDGALRAASSEPRPDVWFSFTGGQDLAARRFRECSGWNDRAATAVDDLATSLDADVACWLAPFTAHVRLFTDFIVSGAGLTALAAFVEQELARGTLTHLQGLYLLACRNAPRTRALDGRFGDDPLLFGLGLYFIVSRYNVVAIDTARALLRSALQICTASGGRPFLYGWNELTRAELAAIYGSDFDEFIALRHALDPAGSFNRKW